MTLHGIIYTISTHHNAYMIYCIYKLNIIYIQFTILYKARANEVKRVSQPELTWVLVNSNDIIIRKLKNVYISSILDKKN
jgi:hypothetical protein